jgi:hypothetical protein
MKLSFASSSLLLIGVSIVLLIAFTLFESALVGMSLGTERLVSFLGLVLLPGIGVVFGMISLARKEGQTGLAVTGMILNALFAIFHLMVILFAG